MESSEALYRWGVTGFDLFKGAALKTSMRVINFVVGFIYESPQ